MLWDFLVSILPALATAASAALGFAAAWFNRQRALLALDEARRTELDELAARAGVAVAVATVSQRPPPPVSLRELAFVAGAELHPQARRGELLAEVDRDLNELRASVAALAAAEQGRGGGRGAPDGSGA